MKVDLYLALESHPPRYADGRTGHDEKSEQRYRDSDDTVDDEEPCNARKVSATCRIDSSSRTYTSIPQGRILRSTRCMRPERVEVSTRGSPKWDITNRLEETAEHRT